MQPELLNPWLSEKIDNFGHIPTQSDTISTLHSTVDHGSPTHGPPACILQPAATLANSISTIKISQ